jgi:hypothetical protein
VKEELLQKAVQRSFHYFLGVEPMRIKSGESTEGSG